MRKKPAFGKEHGLTLLEVIISFVIMALIMTGLVNVFLAVKRHTLHSRSRMQTAELGRYFLGDFPAEVDQSEWNPAGNDYNAPNKLQKTGGTPRNGAAVSLNGIAYNPAYEVGVPPGFAPASPMRKVKVTVSWTEPAP